MLLEKATPTVLHRGVLVPHPRDDYDLLEERLLESLELQQPRILKCGHFHLDADQAAEIAAAAEAHDSDAEDDASELADADMCEDCGRRIRDGRLGDAGTGSKRWDVKVFAANGLMRAGAWSAAWREMERVDVEMLPWMEESMRRELELRSEEEETLRSNEEMAKKEEGVGGLDDERLREIYGQDAQAIVDGLFDEASSAAPHVEPPDPRNSSIGLEPKSQQKAACSADVPLSDLLWNYVSLAVRDGRNVAIFVLSVFVLYLSTRGLSSAPSLPTSESVGTARQVLPSNVPDPVEQAISTASGISNSPKDTVSGSWLPSPEPEPQVDAESEGNRKESSQEVTTNIAEAEDMVSELLED